MKTKSKVALAIVLVCLFIISAGSIALAIISNVRLENAHDKIDSQKNTIESLETHLRAIYGYAGISYDDDYYYDDIYTEDVAQENDVLIGGEYLIQSTEQISDAYKSGDTSGLSEEDLETLNMATEVLDEIITDGMSNYEKEEAVYVWMVSNLEFEGDSLIAVNLTSDDVATPHGVLKYKQGVCVGFATTFRLFMQMMDMDCMVVHDIYLCHSWDMVNLDDGEWYITDIYMDLGSPSYNNFNMTDEMALEGHDWNMDFFPEACGYEYTYVYMNHENPGSVESVVDLMYEQSLLRTTNTKYYSLSDIEFDGDETDLEYYVYALAAEAADYVNLYTDNYADCSMITLDGETYIKYTVEAYEYDEPVDVDTDDEVYQGYLDYLNSVFANFEANARG